MQQLLLIFHVLVAFSLIALVLIQHGKGADAGASFGGGAANTMFGSVGPASFLMKLTSTLIAVFFATTIALGYVLAHPAAKEGFVFPTKKAPVAAKQPAKSAQSDFTSPPTSEGGRSNKK